MTITDLAFTEYFETAFTSDGEKAPARDVLIRLENDFMAKMGAYKSMRPQDGSFRYLYSVFGKQLLSRINYLTKMKDAGKDTPAVRSLLSSHSRLREAMKSMDPKLYRTEFGGIINRNRKEHEKRLKEKASTTTDSSQPQPESSPQPPATPPKIVSSTQGLADYLGCGRTMAFSIIKSGVLKKDAIQYKVGQCWKFNREKLDKYLADNPDILGKIRCKR